MALRAAVCNSSSQRHNCSGNRLPPDQLTHGCACPKMIWWPGPELTAILNNAYVCLPSGRVKTNLLLYHLPIHSGIATRLSIVKHLTSPFSRPRVTVNSSLKQVPYSHLPNIDSLKEKELAIAATSTDDDDGNSFVSFLLELFGPIPPHFRSRKSSSRWLLREEGCLQNDAAPHNLYPITMGKA